MIFMFVLKYTSCCYLDTSQYINITTFQLHKYFEKVFCRFFVHKYLTVEKTLEVVRLLGCWSVARVVIGTLVRSGLVYYGLHCCFG